MDRAFVYLEAIVLIQFERDATRWSEFDVVM